MPGIFEISLILYRDCNGVFYCDDNTCNAPCSTGSLTLPNIDIYGIDPGCNGFALSSVTLSLIGVRDVNINSRCPGSKSICTNRGCVAAGSYTPGIERYEFRGLANIGPTSGIPSSCCNVRLSWTLGARNGNNTGSGGANFYIDAIINRCLSVSPCNSSPDLTNDPFAIICGNENFVFNNGASDPDLDSLSYSFTPALQGFGSAVTYTPPFSFDKPMPWTGSATGVFPTGIHCDPSNGDIMFTPPNSGDFFTGVMAIEIKQWKRINGIMTVVGVTRRDIQMTVRGDCLPDNPPRLITDPPDEGNVNVPKTNWAVCVGDQLCFTVTAKDTDFNPPVISDTTFLSWNAALAAYGATFKPDYDPSKRRLSDSLNGGPREDRYRFCWTPDESRASTTPYYFTVSAIDNHCPDPGRITRAFSVLVMGKGNLRINKNNVGCGKWNFSYTNLNTKFTPVSTFWQISREPGDESMSENPYTFINTANPGNIQFSKGGRYYVLVKAVTPGPIGTPGCEKYIRDSFDVDTVMVVQKRDTFACAGSGVQLTASPQYGRPVFTYRWYNSIRDTATGYLNSNVTLSGFNVTPAVTRYYTIMIRDLNQCSAYDSIRVEVKKLPVGLLPLSERICNRDTFVLDPGNNGGNIRSYLWNVGDTTRTIAKSDSGQYIVTLKDTFNCRQTDTSMLYVNRKIIADAGPDRAVCEGESITLKGKGGQSYQWRSLNNPPLISVNTDTFRITPVITTTPLRYELKVILGYPDSAYRQCSNTDTVEVKVNARPKLQPVTAAQGCMSDPTIYLPSRFLDPTQSPGQGAGSGGWSYPADPGAVITGSAPQIQVNKLKNLPPEDTLGWFDNKVIYTFTGPANLGGCTTQDTIDVRVYGSPPVDAGRDMMRCNIGGVYELTKIHSYSPRDLPLHLNEIWTGPGVDSSFSGGVKYYSFDPGSPLVKELPAKNTLTYFYTHRYSPSISCSMSDQVDIGITEAPVVNVSQDILICQNEPVFLINSKTNESITPSTGTNPYWELSAPAVNGSAILNGQSFNAAAVTIVNGASQNKYLLYYTDTSSGCKVRDSIYLTVARAPKVDLVYNQPVPDSPFVCRNSKEVYFRVYASSPSGGNLLFEPWGSAVQYGGTAAFGYNPGGTGTRHVFNSNQAVPGVYILTVRYTDKTVDNVNGCAGVDSTVLIVQEPPSILVATPAAICSNDTIGRVSLLQRPADGYSFRWILDTHADGYYSNDTSDPSGYIPGLNDRSLKRAIIRAVTLKRVPMGGNGDQCLPAEDSDTLLIYPSPQAGIIPIDSEGCVPYEGRFAAAATGTINAGYTWFWDGIADTSADSMVTRRVDMYETKQGGLYNLRLKVSSNYGTTECIGVSDPKVLTTHAMPEASFHKNPKSTTIAKPYFDFINQSYTVDQSRLHYLWNLGPGPDPLKPAGRLVTLMNPMQIEYAADTACQKVILTATTEYGCMDSTEQEVCIEPDITVFIPTAFRPRSADGTQNSMVPCIDGEQNCNKVFRVVADGEASVEIFVYNRWGQLVFASDSAVEGWDGTVQNNGNEYCPQDVYAYQVKATSFSGKTYQYSGSVTLLR